MKIVIKLVKLWALPVLFAIMIIVLTGCGKPYDRTAEIAEETSYRKRVAELVINGCNINGGTVSVEPIIRGYGRYPKEVGVRVTCKDGAFREMPR